MRPTARGRRREGPLQNHLGTVVEGKEVPSPETNASASPGGVDKGNVANGDGKNTQSGSDKEEDGPPTLNMFNLVLILDKPDPEVSHDTAEGFSRHTLFDEVYREIVFKWTAAAFSLQVQDNYIAKEAWEMAKLRDKGINESERVPPLHCRWSG